MRALYGKVVHLVFQAKTLGLVILSGAKDPGITLKINPVKNPHISHNFANTEILRSPRSLRMTASFLQRGAWR